MSGRVTIVGAGCGACDLITLRGAEALKQCDTVIYDCLIDAGVLELCPNAEKICVGKRAGKHSLQQEEINALLIETARAGKSVVRLKGGDPFVFGRGGEEISALRENGIPYSVIPGISSCIAVPELAGIPVTHRGTARSFHVITGHTAGETADYEKYAGLDGTLVFLMGLGNLDKITRGLISGGMPENTPAAVISNGGTRGQKTVRAALCRVAEAAESAGISAPAVIVAGETAKFDLSASYKPPLSGASVAVISSRETGDKLCAGFRALGADAFRVGGADILELFGSDTDRAFSEITRYDCVALTGPNGAKIFLKKLGDKRVDLRRLSGVKIAAIGRGTAKILESAGLFPDIIPEKFTSAALGKLLSEKIAGGGRVLILRSAEGSAELLKPLAERGIRFDDIHTYKPLYLRGEAVNADYAAFTSAGVARGFFGNGGSVSQGTKCAAIGDITARALKEHGISAMIPEEFSTEGIIKIISEDVMS